jgi:hypothetical protein
MINKIKNQAKLLYERIQYCDRNGIKDNEYLSAKNILKAILDKYGWSQSDIFDTSYQNSYFFKIWVPNIKAKTNPDWLKILVSLVANIYGVKCLTLDKLGFHMSATNHESVADLEEKLSYLVNRSVSCLNLYNNFIKKIDKTSYFLGFAFGYEKYLRNKAKRDLEISRSENESVKTLVVLKSALLNLNKAYENLKNDGTIKPETINTDIQDESSFLIGFHDGMNAEKKLINGNV